MANKIKTIKVISPSRIHCCIINGLHAGEYIGGGIGFAIDEPSNEFTVYMSDNIVRRTQKSNDSCS